VIETKVLLIFVSKRIKIQKRAKTSVMLNPKPNSIQVAVREKEPSNNLTATPNKPGIAKEVNASEIPFWVLLLKLLKSTRIPFISGKHQIIKKYKEYFGKQPFPWFKLSLLALGMYMLFQKDMHFQVNMKAPEQVFSDDRQANEPAALSMSLTHLGKALTGSAFSKETTTPLSKKATTILPYSKEVVAQYVQRFSRIAIMEMQKYQIPASIKMGQAILASQAGGHLLATKYNNHFGTLCNQESASCLPYKTNGAAVNIKSYESAWEGWRDHSEMISKGKYTSLVAHGKDYKKWAAGIAEIGYGNNQEYSKQLIQIIELYGLTDLDKE